MGTGTEIEIKAAIIVLYCGFRNPVQNVRLDSFKCLAQVMVKTGRYQLRRTFNVMQNKDT